MEIRHLTNIFKKMFLSLLLCAGIMMLLSSEASAQSPIDEANAKKCLEDYMSGDGARVEKSFDPTATMKYIDAKTGEFKDVPIAEYIARIKAMTTRPDRKIEIVTLNLEGNAGQAKIRIETDKAILFDFMNLLKINGEWKIVGKIFSRQDK